MKPTLHTPRPADMCRAFCCNMLLLLAAYMVCRVAFLWENIALFPDLDAPALWRLFLGGLRFDVSAVCYTNALYVLLFFLPLHWKERAGYYRFLKILFVAINGIALLSNLMDTVYFQYVNRRTTVSVFSEFRNDGNVAGIIGLELWRHWYLTLLGILLIGLLWRLYRSPRVGDASASAAGKPASLGRYYLIRTLCTGVGFFLVIVGIRSDLTFEERPIANRNAKKYVSRPIETGIVLNTPFSIIRTIGKKPYTCPPYFSDPQQMQARFDPVHRNTMPDSLQEKQPLNVVFLILESFGAEYSGYLNPHLGADGAAAPAEATYAGYMPFLDSLMEQSLTFEYSFSNGRKSIDMAPAVFSSLPMFVEPFFASTASTNDITGLASLLREMGYHTSFFHGADNGSLGFEDFARNAGFERYYGRTEYGEDKDYDGRWGVWDEPFLQYFAQRLSGFKEPFLSALFTLTSHHPFHIPPEYEAVFPDEGKLPIHRCIRYTDHALRQFFRTASRQPWYPNTLFILTGDHTNMSYYKEYSTEIGRFRVPILFFKPGDARFSGHRPGIAQHTDIMPTLLDLLGYRKPFLSFGCNLLTTPAEDTYAVNYDNGVYQYLKGEFLLQFDGEHSIGLYRFRQDPFLQHNLLPHAAAERMEPELKSIIQQYMERMNANQLVVKP